jgi:hypothetical protein
MAISRNISLSFRVLMAGVGFMTLAGAQARADLQFNAGAFGGGLFNYNLNFNNSIDAVTGLPTQRLQSGNFATIYDIANFGGATLDPAFTSLFTVSSQALGITPPGVLPGDGPATNVTVTYTGPTVTADQSFVNVLRINSNAAFLDPNGNYTSLTTKNSGLAAGTGVAAIGSVAVPSNSQTGLAVTPEPGSMAMLAGAGLSGSVFFLKRRRNRK